MKFADIDHSQPYARIESRHMPGDSKIIVGMVTETFTESTENESGEEVSGKSVFRAIELPEEVKSYGLVEVATKMYQSTDEIFAAPTDSSRFFHVLDEHIRRAEKDVSDAEDTLHKKKQALDQLQATERSIMDKLAKPTKTTPDYAETGDGPDVG